MQRARVDLHDFSLSAPEVLPPVRTYRSDPIADTKRFSMISTIRLGLRLRLPINVNEFYDLVEDVLSQFPDLPSAKQAACGSVPHLCRRHMPLTSHRTTPYTPAADKAVYTIKIWVFFQTYRHTSGIFEVDDVLVIAHMELHILLYHRNQKGHG